MLAILLFLQTLSLQAFTTVVIDAGHGGHDRGGIPGQKMAEKVYALDVSKRVEKLLSRAGLKTVMTRSRDVFVPLATRCSIANSKRDAIFVSIHFNSGYRVGANGIETFSYGSEGRRLSAYIHRRMKRAVPFEDRGLKRRGFYVLRNTKPPAVLVECGFLTNPAEARMIRSSRYRQKIAVAIAAGILDYRRARH